ncbi:hypothetical protein CP532_1011 [Ophiocordyceps camponoti-leonardi (nom. inval.)]|nr:hypothetical protein CP532_1011 [Ophiocordyceps camponoti-leonardi (nom. inval.)]
MLFAGQVGCEVLNLVLKRLFKEDRPEVLAGSLAGVLSAAAWFRLTAWLRSSGRLAWALDSAPARALRLRDLVVYEDVCQAGWEKWERERRGLRKML